MPCKPGLYRQDDLQRVLSCGFGRTLAEEVAKLDAREMALGESRHRVLQDALVACGAIVTRDDWFTIANGDPIYSVLWRDIEHHDRVALPNTQQGLHYFGHWLRDDCVSYERAAADGHRILSMPRKKFGDAPIYEQAFGQDWVEVPAFRAKELHLYDDIPYSRQKAKVIAALRARARGAFKDQLGAGRIVYLRRGPSGAARHVVDEDRLCDALAAAGIVVLSAEGGSDFVPQLAGARLVIGVEGSQLAHATHLVQDGGGLLVLQPPDRFYNPHIEWARLLGISYGVVVGETAGEGSFHISAPEVLEMADRILSETQDGGSAALH